uniref:WD_REPEATS_REGION domain-containing protein n=1 Tax=Anopheles epiroticus TaxID=199890 RepID=A0A182PJR6_9DIPT
MGNYCSSGQTKKDKDNVSEKSEESPSYQLADKGKSKGNDVKEAPLAAPEVTSDASGTGQISNSSNATNGCNSSNVAGGTGADGARAQTKALQNVQSMTLSDSTTNSPMTVSPPCDIPPVHQNLPQNLTPLYGKPTTNRRTDKYKKIVLYILAADDGFQTEKAMLREVFKGLNQKCQSRGFELHVADLHVHQPKGNSFDVNKWFSGPLEAQGGHELAANCLAEIARQSCDSYLIPVLFLGGTLGDPLLPLTIESQDFVAALQMAERNPAERAILEKWYVLDDKSQPACYRLNATATPPMSSEESQKELAMLLQTLIDIFSKELRDSYLTTVVEQEINNTVLISQELSKRCIWIQSAVAVPKAEGQSSVEVEMVRRLTNIQSDLKNQLSEKHIIRIPANIAQQQQEQFGSMLDTCLSLEIDSIIDEHVSKYSIPHCTHGVDRRLLSELEEVNRHSRVLNENCANFSTTERVREYLTSACRGKPLVVYGSMGAGKSVFMAKLSQNLHSWLPESHLVMRYANLTMQSSDVTGLLGSITEQISVLIKGVPTRCQHTISSYAGVLKSLLESSKHQITILIDSIDALRDVEDLDWLPVALLDNVKLVLTVSSTGSGQDLANAESHVLQRLRERIGDDSCFLYLTPFTQEQWEDVLCFGGGDIYAANGALQLPECWKKSDEKISIQAKILWWLGWLGITNLSNTSVSHISERVFEILEEKFTAPIVKLIMSLLLASREGLLETEIITLIRNSNLVNGSTTKLWTHFCWKMGPLFLHNKNIIVVDRTLRQVAEKRYEADIKQAHRILYDYYELQPNVFLDKKGKEKCFNYRKIVELPYHKYKLDATATESSFSNSPYLTDLAWLQDKLIATGCVHILNDICLVDGATSAGSHVALLKSFIESHFKALNYDGHQLYSMLRPVLVAERQRADSPYANSAVVQQWLETINSSPVPFLEKLVPEYGEDDGEKPAADKAPTVVGFDLMMNLSIAGYFVISLSTEREEICVWDVAKCRKVRTLTGVPQPSAICPVGDYGVAVLCRREIRIIDLNEGKFKVTLKGVMNQKMPYFGLHDPSHLVCLSRNRMYVNLMNIESGDCVTTFKAGEDRFLNSLLVSGDGRILVCGDETQKPFPLLVWHLSQKKLLYDLRIPHHDFITSLSAITHEGSYVCVVAKELAEPSPNFIVVYDLQSGTLFKKWKPSCNTVSLAISQTNTCVIAGLEDARILIWDLVTGNCRSTLVGHSAPVTLLKIDPTGKILLSTDKEGRDMSIRLWQLDSGNLLAVYTPEERITTCEILSGGAFIALALENRHNLITLKLRTGKDGVNEEGASVVYGNSEHNGKQFDLKQ